MMEQDKIELYHSFKPTRFPVLDRLELRQNTVNSRGGVALNIELTLRSDDENDQNRLTLLFVGVRDLQFEPKIQPIQFGFIQVVSIHDYQWQDVHYKVVESEQDVKFSLLCDDITVTLK